MDLKPLFYIGTLLMLFDYSFIYLFTFEVLNLLAELFNLSDFLKLCLFFALLRIPSVFPEGMRSTLSFGHSGSTSIKGYNLTRRIS